MGLKGVLAKRDLSFTVDISTGCWISPRAKNDRGYTQIRINNRVYYLHRLFYQHFGGALEDGQVVDHLCRNPSCINPLHLEAVTQTENLRRGLSTSLTEEQVVEIRRLYSNGNHTFKSIGNLYGVDSTTIGDIVRGTGWRDVDGAVSKDNKVKGAKHHSYKLSPENIRDIVERKGETTAKALSEEFGVHIRTIYHIWKGERGYAQRYPLR